MHGSSKTSILLSVLLAGGIVGCGSSPLPVTEPPGPKPLGQEFNSAATGAIQGQVTWKGPIPLVEPFISHPNPTRPPRGTGGKREWLSPHAPQIDPGSKGLKNAVLYLKGIDLKRSRPWDHPPVRLECSRWQLSVHQGTTISNIGLVRKNEAIEMVSQDPWLYGIKGRGADCFNIKLPDPQVLQSRRLQKPGIVSIQSGTGRYWMRSYLFVSEHPYFARTDAEGQFELQHVPEGKYELHCWVPNWHVKSKERDWSTSQHVHVTFHKPVEIVQSITIEAGKIHRADLSLSSASFEGAR